MLRMAVILACLLGISPPAFAQAARSADERVKALLENDQVRVREMRWPPGSRTAPANFPNSFVYPLTEGTLVIAHPGRTPFEMSFRAGEPLWLPSQSASTANETQKEIRALVVEIKVSAPVKRGVKARAAAGSKPKAAPKPQQKSAGTAGTTKKN